MVLSRRVLIGGMFASITPRPTLAAMDDSGDEDIMLARSETRRQIHLCGAVDTRSLMQLNIVLGEMADESDEPIHLHLQSGGGELLPALYTSDLIAQSSAPVYTYVDGFAASATAGGFKFTHRHPLEITRFGHQHD